MNIRPRIDERIKSYLQYPGSTTCKTFSHASQGDCEGNSTKKKVIILGSGGLSIGQAGEFDYSGSQVKYIFMKN